MSDRHYGINSGSRPERSRTPVSPMISPYDSIDSSREYHNPLLHRSCLPYHQSSGQSSERVSPVSIRAGPPAPPPHRSGVSPLSQISNDQAIGGQHCRHDVPQPQHGFLRDLDNLYGGPPIPTPSPEPQDDSRFVQRTSRYQSTSLPPQRPPLNQHADSQTSVTSSRPLMSAVCAPAAAQSPSNFQGRMPGRNSSYFQGDGYDEIDPREIADDDDDDMDQGVRPQHNRRSRREKSRSLPAASASMQPTPVAVTAMGGLTRAFSGPRSASGNYALVENKTYGRPSTEEPNSEKSEWLEKQSSSNKRMRWIIAAIIAIVLISAIVGGTVGGILANKGSSSSSSSPDTNSGNDYNLHSSQVQAVLNNKDLHKVFPGMDYTPLNAQYPDCLTNPPDQNNVTLDIAVLSQLTPAVRLYGTDCNQTELVLSAISALEMEDTLQVWLGVWLGKNDTTNTRQLDQMYTLLSSYPSSRFAGVIIGNEVLYREDLTETELGDILHNVRKNLTSSGITSLPVSTSDLGDNWTPALAADTDIVMANVHPFFAGQKAAAASGWTWDFWQNKDAGMSTNGENTGSWPKSIISETGWPSTGGNDCGTGSASCSAGEGAVAGIDEMNTFMEDFVCTSLNNQTTYFWFEAFDEPWKVVFDTDDDKWESKWGLFDANRDMKAGLKIPDCDGATVDKPWF